MHTKVLFIAKSIPGDTYISKRSQMLCMARYTPKRTDGGVSEAIPI
jgi:hypothetical protein